MTIMSLDSLRRHIFHPIYGSSSQKIYMDDSGLHDTSVGRSILDSWVLFKDEDEQGKLSRSTRELDTINSLYQVLVNTKVTDKVYQVDRVSLQDEKLKVKNLNTAMSNRQKDLTAEQEKVRIIEEKIMDLTTRLSEEGTSLTRELSTMEDTVIHNSEMVKQ